MGRRDQKVTLQRLHPANSSRQHRSGKLRQARMSARTLWQRLPTQRGRESIATSTNHWRIQTPIDSRPLPASTTPSRVHSCQETDSAGTNVCPTLLPPRLPPHAAGPRPANAKAHQHVLHAALQAAVAAQRIDQNRQRRADRIAAVFQLDRQPLGADVQSAREAGRASSASPDETNTGPRLCRSDFRGGQNVGRRAAESRRP